MRLTLYKFIGLSCLSMLIARGARSEDWDGLMHRSLGQEAVDYNHNGQFRTYADTIMVDGSITSLPTHAVTYDRTLMSYTDFYGDIPLGPRFGLKLDLMAKYAMRIVEGKEEPRIISRQNWAEVQPKIGFTFFTKNNLELFAGVANTIIPKYEQRTESAAVDTVSSYSDVSMAIPHVGILKRTGGFQAGFYYKGRAEKSRTVRKYTSQDDTELTFSEQVFDPTTVALFFQGVLNQATIFSEFAAVQASDGGEETDDGKAVMDDYLRARLSGYLPLMKDTSLRLMFTHKTLSYANNHNVTLSTIPMTSVFAQFIQGDDKRHSFIGLIYAYGKDGQSLPEFNAKYNITAYGLTAGLKLAL